MGLSGPRLDATYDTEKKMPEASLRRMQMETATKIAEKLPLKAGMVAAQNGYSYGFFTTQKFQYGDMVLLDIILTMDSIFSYIHDNHQKLGY